LIGRLQPEKGINQANWTLTVAPAWKTVMGDAVQVLHLLHHPDTLVQEHDRGSVSFVRVGGGKLVAKRSITQERRRWVQLTSLYRGGEGARAFRAMLQLQKAGMPVPEPVLTLERKYWRFVVASWHVYRYLDGQECTCADAALITRTLAQLHQHGWIHRDPHVKNFLKVGDRAVILDWTRARPWRLGYARRYDLVLLNDCCPGAGELYPGFSASDPLFILAQWQKKWINQWREIKRTVRSRFRIRRNSGSGF
jgi:tRNA A-37 threonylcarbamoyl transferase component Bud32